MKKAILILLPLLLLLPDIVFGYDIVAVMDAERPHYQQALLGFQEVCDCSPTPMGGVKSIQHFTLSRIIIGDKNDAEVTANIRSCRPDLILAVGNRGLRAATAVPGIPILYMLVTHPNRIVGQRSNITGVELRLPADLQLQTIHSHLPDLKRLGVIYDPRRTGALISEAKIAAPAHGISLLASPIHDRSKIPQLLGAMQRANLDGFWMVPDLTVLSPATLQDIFLFSLENKIPLITFADKFLHLGAAVSITFNMRAVGIQAGEIAQEIAAGTPISAISPRAANQTTVKENDLIIKKLGVTYKRTGQQGGAR